MTTAALTTQWRMCQGCGHWQLVQEDSTCSVCQWSRFARDTPSTDLAEMRVLVDVELRLDRTWHVTGVTSSRLGAAISQAVVLQQLNDDGLLHLLGEVKTSKVLFPSWRFWERFRDFARLLLLEEFNSLIRRSWEGLRQPSSVRVFVSIRAMLFSPDIVLPKGETASGWLEVVNRPGNLGGSLV